MNNLLFKQIIILSSVMGAILGVLGLIPFVRNIAIFLLMCFVAPVVIVYLKKLNFISEVSIQKGMVIGTLTGIISVIAFMLIFTPFVLLISLFVKNGFIYWIASLIKNSGFFVFIFILVLLGILNGLINAFSGLTTAYLYDFLKNVKE